MLTLYRQLLWYRRRTPALAVGSYQPLDSAEDCFVYLRGSAADQLLIALNFAGQAQEISIPDHEAGNIIISTHLDRQGEEALTTLKLRAFEGLVIALN
jgi:alpha-glucosidase